MTTPRLRTYGLVTSISAALVVVAPTPTRAETPSDFEPQPMVGARVGGALPWGAITGAGGYDDPIGKIVGPGMLLEADLGLRVDRCWTIYGFWEHGALTRGSKTQDAPRAPASNAFGLGFQINSVQRGRVALIFDLASGIVLTDTQVPERSYSTPTSWRDSNSWGWMPFRAGFGVSFSVWGPLRLDVLATHSVSIPFGGTCPDGCGNLFGYFGLTAGVRVGK